MMMMLAPAVPGVATIELRTPAGWRQAATVSFSDARAGMQGPCRLEYDLDYAIEQSTDPRGVTGGLAAVASGCPVDFASYYTERWPGWLDDIRPGGAARRWWVARLGLERHPEAERDVPLLIHGAMAPIGHLRIAEAVPAKGGPPPRFAIRAVVERDHEFLDHAAEMGASVGGATGAGGEAPKLALRVGGDQAWIDTWQDEPANVDAHYLVKFARNRRSEVDKLVLRCEHVYYRALSQLGIDSIDTAGLRLEEGEREPSLWLPRFDVRYDGGFETRLGLESHYAVIDAPPGSWQTHEDFLAGLHRVFAAEPDYDPEALTVEYLRRDLLNEVFGNTDNHGRNSAILKTPEALCLAPVYDFAPMKLDPEGIVRTTRWREHERGGQIAWRELTESLGQYGRPEVLFEGLRSLGARLRDLPERLEALGLPHEALVTPRLGLTNTEAKLARWGLL